LSGIHQIERELEIPPKSIKRGGSSLGDNLVVFINLCINASAAILNGGKLVTAKNFNLRPAKLGSSRPL
jgi:hypothetical protein